MVMDVLSVNRIISGLALDSLVYVPETRIMSVVMEYLIQQLKFVMMVIETVEMDVPTTANILLDIDVTILLGENLSAN